MARIYRSGSPRTAIASGSTIVTVIPIELTDNEVADILMVEYFVGGTVGRDRMAGVSHNLDKATPTNPNVEMFTPDMWTSVVLAAIPYVQHFDPPVTVGGPQLFVAFNNGASTDALTMNLYYTKRRVSAMEKAMWLHQTSYGIRREA